MSAAEGVVWPHDCRGHHICATQGSSLEQNAHRLVTTPGQFLCFIQ